MESGPEHRGVSERIGSSQSLAHWQSIFDGEEKRHETLVSEI